jgi:hypothetical protein
MPDLWRHMLELSIELEKLDEAGNYRDGRDPVRQRGKPQRLYQAGPQTRPVIERQNHLARILDVIPEPPQEYQPYRSNLPARREVISRSHTEYPPNISRLPARQDEYFSRPHTEYPPNISRLPAHQNEYFHRGYTRHVTQIDVVPMDWRQRPSRAPKTNEWRSYMIASCLGAVIGIGGYTYLSHSGSKKGEAARAPALAAVASAVQRPRVAPDDAFRERVSNQLVRADVPSPEAGDGNPQYRGDVPGAGAGYGAMAQSPGGALFERASNLPPPGDAPRAQAAYTIPQQPDDALLAQASYKLSHGDVFGARAAFETVAQRGGALGAFGLAETYDPNVLARRRVLGLKPDAGLARLWYERAANLGNAEASLRLQKLTKPSHAMPLPKLAASPKPVSSSQSIASGSEVLRAR